MLGLCVAVIGGIIYFAVAKQSPMAVFGNLGARVAPRVAVEEPAETVQPEEQKKAGTKTAAKGTVRPVPSAVTAPASIPEVTMAEAGATPAPPAPVKRGPQPAARDLAIGMSRAELFRRFPDPAVQTSTIKNGDLIELIVYEGSDTGVATFAQLLNGQVNRVYTGTPTRPGRRLAP